MRRIDAIMVAGLSFAAAAPLFNGCDNRLHSPAPTGPDTTDNDDNDGDPPYYGDIYFVSNSGTRWALDGSVVMQNGNLRAFNATDDTIRAAALLVDQVDFGRSVSGRFVWKEGLEAGGDYLFFIGEDGQRWDDTPHSEEAGRRVALFGIFGNSRKLCRFEFALPPGATVAIDSLRGYGI